LKANEIKEFFWGIPAKILNIEKKLIDLYFTGGSYNYILFSLSKKINDNHGNIFSMNLQIVRIQIFFIKKISCG